MVKNIQVSIFCYLFKNPDKQAHSLEYLIQGTITNVTFRVKYDDGDTETQTEKEVWENLIDHDTYFSEQDTSGNMLELFSGCSLLSTMVRDVQSR